MATKKTRRAIALQIDDQILAPAIDRIIAFSRKRYGNDPIACEALEAVPMRLIRAAMTEAIIALDDLILTEDPKNDRSHGSLVLQPGRAASWSCTRSGLRAVFGAEPGDFDRLKRSGPLAIDSYTEQAEARMGRENPLPPLSFSTEQIESDGFPDADDWKRG